MTAADVMKLRLPLFCLPVFLAGWRLLAADSIPLPADPTLAVVELWYVDQGRVGEPEISVFASGRIRVGVGEGSIWGQLDPSEVQSLVAALLQQDGLARVTTEQLQQALDRESARTGLSAHIAGAGDTIIRIRTAPGSYRIDGHAVGLLAGRFPGVQPLQQLAAAQRRLENVRAIVMAGGTPAAERLARLAQARMQAEYGEEIAVKSQDLSLVRSLGDGSRYCQFIVPGRTPAPGDARVISLIESPGEAPRVSVLPNESRVQ